MVPAPYYARDYSGQFLRRPFHARRISLATSSTKYRAKTKAATSAIAVQKFSASWKNVRSRSMETSVDSPFCQEINGYASKRRSQANYHEHQRKACSQKCFHHTLRRKPFTAKNSLCSRPCQRNSQKYLLILYTTNPYFARPV